MNRTTLTRLAFAAVAVPALAFGAPATALADSFFSGEANAAGPKGAMSHDVKAVAFDGHHDKDGDEDGHHGHHDGGAFFKKSASWAGPHGAGVHSVVSAAR
ncbi:MULTISPECIES: hypothetical protein [Nocardiopsis]|uniref:Calcium-binding protein n=1 Tax=Nocardiopsis sinuspersici TaxID=501010 RepID=A0A1V3C0E0_9ACTN|nr:MULTISPECIES: hypothetical protein [Nocardiopsis]NYH55559.1 hypothetical protein [Nocardiopsis sinuspersici]OOC54175.1 hypothetical protein NOSIN_10450 [Nocardiopsis sinuspersici]